MDKSLGMKISELIWEHDPKVTECDPEACARAANELAGVLGALVATLTIVEPDRHNQVMGLVMDAIERSARTIRARAIATRREAGHA